MKNYKAAFILVLLLSGCGKSDKNAPHPNDRPVAFSLSGGVSQRLDPLDRKARPLPNVLLIKPGVYSVDGQTYDVREGLFRVFRPNGSGEQRVVFKDDKELLIESLTWIKSHGDINDDLFLEQLRSRAKTHKLVITCGTASKLIQSLLRDAGIESRIVVTMTLEKLNGYDNGHTMLEVNLGGKWVLYDFDNNVYFENGHPLSFEEFIAARGNYAIKPISNAPALTVDRGKSDTTFYSEAVYSNLKEWYARVDDVGMIEMEGDYFFPDIPQRKQVESYSNLYKPMPRDEFMRTFYPHRHQ
jgi:hypothetical protein